MMEQEEEEYELVKGWNGHTPRPPIFADELNACRQIEASLVQECLRSTINDIAGQCKDQYENGVRSQIFTVQFKQNQQAELAPFIEQLQAKFETGKGNIFGLKEGKASVVMLGRGQVREIVLQMYIHLEERKESGPVVFIGSEMSDINQHNLQCFQKGLRQKRFVVILCTVSVFQNKHENGSTNFQKYHYKLYNSRELFCKYLFYCMASPRIKPYLPCGVLTLISDFDYYSISFHQSCRRFMFCLQRALLLLMKHPHPRQRIYVDLSIVFLLEEVITSKISFYPGARDPYEKMLKVILDQSEMYTISEKAIVYQIAFASRQAGQKIEEQSILSEIREQLKKCLSGVDRWEKYAQYLEDQQEGRETVFRKRRSRADMLGIDPHKNITPKHRLQNQITRILKDATAGVRLQAAALLWNDINFESRIRPQFQLQTRKGWMSDNDCAKLLEEIGSTTSAPLSYYIQMFADDIGKGIYLIKCLQMAGLIKIRGRNPNPIVYNTVFEKARFSGPPK